MALTRSFCCWGAAKCGEAVAPSVASAAAALAKEPIDDLSPARHLSLLAFLCDEALDTLLLHNVLQSEPSYPPPPSVCQHSGHTLG